MSTRCNLIIKKGSQKVQLYRHCDGYPEGAGADIANMVKMDFVNDKIAPETFARTIDILEGNPLYNNYGFEYEEGIGAIHGDIEYLYTIDLNERTIECCVPFEYRTIDGMFVKYHDERRIYLESFDTKYEDYHMIDPDVTDEVVDSSNNEKNESFVVGEQQDTSEILEDQDKMIYIEDLDLVDKDEDEEGLKILIETDITSNLSTEKRLELQWIIQTIIEESTPGHLTGPIKFI